MERPLTGKKILVTREASQAKAFSKEIALRGGIPVEVPLLQVRCLHKIEDKPIWERLSTYKWIFFTSANGVSCFFEQLATYGIGLETIADHQIAAVGHKTELVLKEYRYSADFIPTVYDADTMAKEFLKQYPGTRGPILLVRGTRSREVLPEVFTSENIIFDSVEVYDTVDYVAMGPVLEEALEAQDFDFLTFASPSSAEVFMKLVGEKIVHNDHVVACIGTTTERKVKELGFSNTIIPSIFTIEGMIDSIEEFIKEGYEKHD